MNYEIKEQTQKAWGWEVRISAFDSNLAEPIYYSVEVMFPKQPSTAFLNRECQRRANLFEYKLNNPDPEPEQTFSENEVTQILRKKGYLGDTESFSEDMTIKEIVHG